MKKHKTIILSLLLIGSFQFSTIAQTDQNKSKLAYSVSYWHGIKSDNGFQLGIEKYRLETEKFDVLVNASMLLQQRSDLYTSVALTVGSTLRRNYSWGLYFDHSVKAGYAGQTHNFDIYKTNSNDELVNIGRSWISYAIVGYSFAIGYDLSKITKVDFSLFVRPNIYLKLPNKENLFLLNNYGVEVGLAYRPSF